jgi:hypothetical protein
MVGADKGAAATTDAVLDVISSIRTAQPLTP